MNIEGARYVPDFITREEEMLLLHEVDSSPWMTALQRRVQHYGWEYIYKTRQVQRASVMPEWTRVCIDRLGFKADQMIVNEYTHGQGIAPHVDNERVFGEDIAMVTLEGYAWMDFEKDGVKQTILLEPRSMLHIRGEARHRWTHGIKPRKTHDRRVSLTFRVMKFV